MATLAELLVHLEPAGTIVSDQGAQEQTVRSITSDSRSVEPGDLFVALRGTENDGHEYIAQAVARGCLAVVADRSGYVDQHNTTVVQVNDSRAALGELAAAWYGHPATELKCIGLTGTNGKTTCSWLLEEMLVQNGCFPGVIGTVNYRYHDYSGLHVIQEAPLTTPDPMLLQRVLRTMVDNDVTHVIMEVSSHALEQKRLGNMGFDVALFTNLSQDHLDYHQSMEAYFASKMQLFTEHLKHSGIAVVVTDQAESGGQWGERLAAAITSRPVIRCGTAETCDVFADDLCLQLDGFSALLHVGGETRRLRSPLTGKFNVLNTLAAIAIGWQLGLEPDGLCSSLAAVATVPGRLEHVPLPGKATPNRVPSVFVDYAHTPDALENVLKALRLLTKHRLVCIFGCGGDRDKGKRPVMGRIAARLADVVILTSDNPRREDPEAIIEDIVPGMQEGGMRRATLQHLFFEEPGQRGFIRITDRRNAIHCGCSLAAPGDTVLIAGKGHEDYQITGTSKRFFDDRIEALNGLLQWNQQHLLTATQGMRLGGEQQTVFKRIITDSREITRGDVFVALRGEHFDGHDYLLAAVEQGAAALIVQEMDIEIPESVLVIGVDDTLEALGDLARYRRQLLGPAVRLVAITGSTGKTTVKEMTAAIFEQQYQGDRPGIDPVLKTMGNFNNLIGLPLSLLPIHGGSRVGVLEMGMNSFGEIRQLTSIADPDIGCITNVQAAHIEGLGSLEGVARAKGELFDNMRQDSVRVINFDDPHIRALASRCQGKCIGFAVTAAGRKYKPRVRITRVHSLAEQGMRFTLHLDAWQERISIPAPGQHNVSNCAAAAAITFAAGVPAAAIVRGLQQYQAVDKRLVISSLPGGMRVVNDTYNANPGSMRAALQTVATFGGDCQRVAALGDMFELGSAADAAHIEVGELVVRYGYQLLAVTGEKAELIAQGAREAGMGEQQVLSFESPQAIATWVFHLITSGRLGQGDWLLVKGSRGMRMERLVEELQRFFELQTGNTT